MEAGLAAATYCVELNASSQFFHWRNLAGKVQRRLAAIVQELPDRKKEKKCKEVYDKVKILQIITMHFSHFQVMFCLSVATGCDVPDAIIRATRNPKT